MKQNKQCGAMNLWFVSTLMMLVTLAALAFLYFVRYGQLPMQDAWRRWGKSATVITQEFKQASGVTTELGAAGSGKAVTVNAGIRRCTVKGKVIFSDVECTDENPTTRAVKLYDSKGGEPPKPAAPAGDGQAELDMKKQMLEKALQ